MGKSTDRNVTTEEFAKLEQVLNQTAEDASNCLRLLKKHLSEYDSRNGNHFVNTATSYMRSDMRTAKDTAMDLKHVAHQIHKSHKPSKTEISSARNMMDATSKAMGVLNTTARNYDKENGQSMGVKGRMDAAFGGDRHKEKDEQHGLFGEKENKHKESEGGFFGKSKDEGEGRGGLLGKSDQEKDQHRGGFLGGDDNNGGGIVGSTETVETLVKKTLRDNFSVSALDHQISAAEKSLSPSIAERAKEAVHDVKDKIKGDKSSPTHEGRLHHEGRHVEP
ncbi:hypothetical protein PRIC1_006786 [Phytophthora ramorum]|uniref:Uncharacterized protein n=1 Tax=Phytophthora ramorum TaxID=164328 RepID=H3H5N8_PHYRM|nr:hypothetical protein KRP23_5563 [Phytophthora ramorum]KAH7482400.1 hypothetical protein KRP23_5568 [Phytophthora ramorum]KAH7505732.1 hypothetical protein KRP22_3704 [Phytophthora ramorum]KAH7505737.1 hypothetical protein KRP22_3709 [Phytophthora ramorum]